MKNIFILHSLNGDTTKTWGKDVKEVFSNQGINVYMPEFPIRADSKYETFENILAEYLNKGLLNNHSIVIAHSIGNAYFVRFCKEKDYKPGAFIAVAPGAVYEYPTTRTDYIISVKKQAIVKEYALEYVKNIDCPKYCLYSDEDDNNKEKFARFINDIAAQGIYLMGYNHFDGYHDIYKIPELNQLVSDLI